MSAVWKFLTRTIPGGAMVPNKKYNVKTRYQMQPALTGGAVNFSGGDYKKGLYYFLY